jgi:hypothetical protein
MAHLQTTMQAIEARETDHMAAAAAELVQEGGTDAAADVDVTVPAEPVWRDGDPDVGDWVVYQPRRGMVRRGRNRVAALVVHRHPHARLLDLAIFYEASDTLDDQRVPEAVGDERGWIVKEQMFPARPASVEAAAESVRQDIADLRALIFGEFEKPEVSLLDLLSMLDERVDKLERAKPKAKRKYTRKAKAPAEAPKAE